MSEVTEGGERKVAGDDGGENVREAKRVGAKVRLPDGFYQLKKPKWYSKRANQISKGKKKDFTRLGHLRMEFGWQEKVELRLLFPGVERFALEIGMGDGGNMISYLDHNTTTSAIGVEIHKSSIADAMRKVEAAGFEGRARFVGGDAVKFMKGNCEDGIFDEILIMFPDPWEEDGMMNRQHKKAFEGKEAGAGEGKQSEAEAKAAEAERAGEERGEAKKPKKGEGGDRRIVCHEVVQVIHKKLKVGGKLHIATDVESYATHVRTLMDTLVEEGIFTGGERDAKKEWRKQRTKYEERGLGFGHTVHDFVFVKV